MIRPSAIPSAVTALCLALSSVARGAESPSGTRGHRPHYPWHGSFKAVVDQTAAIVEGTVTGVAESYDEQDGPRTLVTLSDLKVWWGDQGASHVTLRLFGGPVPGRRGRVNEVHVPTFVQDQRYLVFLSNRDWRLSPVTARQSFVVERVHDKDLVVTTDGYAVFGVDDATGPRHAFPVYRIPDEIEDGFVPTPDADITPAMLRDAHSVSELVTELKAWASRNGVSVNGVFDERPYRASGSVWRILRATPDESEEAAASTQEFAPRVDGPRRPFPEPSPCGEHSVPTDSEPGDLSSTCLSGGVR